MFLICITHALARDVPLGSGQFRALHPTGRDEAVNAAKQFEQDGLRLITDRIDGVVTSQKHGARKPSWYLRMH